MLKLFVIVTKLFDQGVTCETARSGGITGLSLGEEKEFSGDVLGDCVDAVFEPDDSLNMTVYVTGINQSEISIST